MMVGTFLTYGSVHAVTLLHGVQVCCGAVALRDLFELFVLQLFCAAAVLLQRLFVLQLFC